MKVSKSRIWVILILLLLLVGCGYYWFFNNEVVITEKYPRYISAEEVPLEDYVYEILLHVRGKMILPAVIGQRGIRAGQS